MHQQLVEELEERGGKRTGESASVRTEAWMARRREGAARWRPTEADSGSRPVANADQTLMPPPPANARIAGQALQQPVQQNLRQTHPSQVECSQSKPLAAPLQERINDQSQGKHQVPELFHQKSGQN